MSGQAIATIAINGLILVAVGAIGALWRGSQRRIEEMAADVKKIESRLTTLDKGVTESNGQMKSWVHGVVEGELSKQVARCRERERELEEVSAVRTHPHPEMMERS
jgi:hypothetical protein